MSIFTPSFYGAFRPVVPLLRHASLRLPGETLLRLLGAQRLRECGRRENVQVQGKFPCAEEHPGDGSGRPRLPLPCGVFAVSDDAGLLEEVVGGREKHGSTPGQVAGETNAFYLSGVVVYFLSSSREQLNLSPEA